MNGKTIIAFIAGAAIGSFATWKYMNKLYSYNCCGEYIEEESEEENIEPSEPVDERAPSKFDKPDLMQYAAILKEARYAVDISEDIEEEGGEEPMKHEKPYVIPPEEFGEEDEYETVSLFYHADGVLTDTENNVIENVEDIVGEDSLNHFGEYEDDSVFVRNDNLRKEYEILLDPQNYSDVDSSPQTDEE